MGIDRVELSSAGEEHFDRDVISVLHALDMDCRSDPLAIRRARGFVASAVKDSGLADLADRAELLTSEVVTNAVIRSQSPVQLVVDARSSSVVVEVRDEPGHASVAVEGEQVAEAGSGRGMMLVDSLSDRWGSWTLDDGTVVWFALVAS